MGVTIEVWRIRIGLFHGGNRCKSSDGKEDVLSQLLMILKIGAVIALLLLIGGIELNPGPFPCKICSVVPETIASNIRHQNFHANNINFMYHCPSESCMYYSTSFSGLKYHVSIFHRTHQHQDSAATDRFFCPHMIDDGEDCSFSTMSLFGLVQHLYQHLDEGYSVWCPIEGCTFPNSFSKKSTFQVHLSQYHRNWRAEGCPKQRFRVTAPCLQEEMNDIDIGDLAMEDENMSEQPQFDEDVRSDLLNDELIYNSIAKFYLNLYAVDVLPLKLIQEICED